MKLKRREFIKIFSSAGFGWLAQRPGWLTDRTWPKNTKLMTNALTGQPLFVPPLYAGETIAGEQHYQLFLETGEHQLVQNQVTPTWVVNTQYSNLPMLGPTLRLRRGDAVKLTYYNGLEETTTMHGHGMAVPGPADGGPHQRILPGTEWTAQYVVSQPACTNWYHPHEMGKTAEHVYRGLAGFILVEDEVSEALGLPSTYGFDDFPLAIQDRRFDASGQFDYSPTNQEIRQGYFGDASNSEIWEFGFSDNRQFVIVAGDNGFLPKPVETRTLVLSPAERAEIIVDFNQDRHARLALLVAGLRSGLVQTGLVFEVEGGYGLVERMPGEWPEDDFVPSSGLPERLFDLGGQGGLRINGQSMNINVINEQVPLGQKEIWRVRSTMGMMHHNFHVHGGSFRVLTRNGSALAVALHERGEKDTVYLAPGDEVTLEVGFQHRADTSSPYMYHCHFLEHEDAGMMGQFTVT